MVEAGGEIGEGDGFAVKVGQTHGFMLCERLQVLNVQYEPRPDGEAMLALGKAIARLGKGGDQLVEDGHEVAVAVLDHVLVHVALGGVDALF